MSRHVQLVARYGERLVEIRSFASDPIVYDGTLYRVSIDGDPLIECFVDLDDAQRRAEEDVGAPLTWEDEA